MIGIISTVIFIVILLFSYTQNYPNAIKYSYYFNLEIQTFINNRYAYAPVKSVNDKIDYCIQEMDFLVKCTSIFLIVSVTMLIITYIFTRVMVYIKISKAPPVKPTIQSYRHAAMDTGTLANIKVVEK
ncbi:hypothetical protein ECANGB1_146 [Enterospora canceri]|uniref:Uncharacterized protein n=1 Tax=Enterospora canceri TaxID=1081671 RepID=A0A1Y1S888_9MICR|nr:hypothetical protein ECANGB1_146 [Enterospora canceri]